MKKNITKIEPKNCHFLNKKCVVAYARVSDGKEAMLHSLSAQVSYYSDYIQNHKNWEYTGVYIDKAYTGTKGERPEFQKLIQDCRKGKIDMIICKSITRFARNTVDMLLITRELKNLSVDVYFEQEKIHSLSEDGELMLTILASYAQEESRVVSENCKWKLRKKFKSGIPNNFKIYGYELKNGRLEITTKEAKIIKIIFKNYLEGLGKNAIMKKLNKLKIKPKISDFWNESTIDKILRNEKYVGDMLFQKTYVNNHLEKKKIKNSGELPMYLVKNSHEAIIDREIFDKVQNEIRRRAEIYKPKNKLKSESKYLFTSKIKCEICGKNYRRKINGVGTKYEKAVWICSSFNLKGKFECSSKQVPEEILKSKIAEILNLSEFNEEKFKEKFKEINLIEISKAGSLNFIFQNGTIMRKVWSYKSRSESWTPEMKEKARQKSLERSNQNACNNGS
ncbi:MAG: recombinase family protein [Candidatus Improbicoccus devescovinae]|nr:MAG: recombinase family protein [Candidatus Improbicoccus devescovinae]GMB10652.1 MAG: recombinase family protein [Candidatus Improbicoccus devescovinae]